MFKLFILFIYSFLYSIEAGAGTLGEIPKQIFNADLTDLKLLILSNSNEENIQKLYSTFISDLVSSGHEITIKTYNRYSQEQDLQLFLYDEFFYNNIIILDIVTSDVQPSFPTSYVSKILDFIDRGGNLMIFVDTLDDQNFNIGENKGIIRLARECAGITFLPQNTRLLDVSIDGMGEPANIFSKNCIESEAIFSLETCTNKGILYHGIGFLNNIPNNELIIPILTACHTCVSVNNSIKSKSPSFFGNYISSSTGEEIGLIMSMQGRNGARATFSSDGKLCSNEAIKSNSGNFRFCRDIFLWSFQQKGLIKITEILHKNTNDNSKTIIENYDDTLNYTVEDTIHFSAKFYKFIDNKWEDYESEDIQLEFTMLDPYIRTYLKKSTEDSQSSTFSSTFKIPEVWGVYKFVINHKKIGFNTISYESITTVRNFRHDQNERFIISAMPYYSAFILAIISFCYFTLLFFTQNDIYLRKCKNK
ncbi:dolichyl-diphosphooligosaccharide-protein glycosyltransferase beta subunit [Cryptosporidium ubiquitum]|uniref:Dolichyl-diphosphooligosaccharide--protein glycosyltransferase 48 kDa subunit n=1 Tax=Cryptosporidium ubiquitum TaxID=857276 RepID=A0A1J4MBY8_9CRYT|nr:dolichyl-diphosphooligosaccharide-protein glycosyltransferase beta subunit [Cryptosporidium ubiquitum]OII71738.1 dolichyl-diphosphooligosaccharide-protein glycosyltransferase beta subunit [Cryptosporidium ubiquitum]